MWNVKWHPALKYGPALKVYDSINIEITDFKKNYEATSRIEIQIMRY